MSSSLVASSLPRGPAAATLAILPFVAAITVLLAVWLHRHGYPLRGGARTASAALRFLVVSGVMGWMVVEEELRYVGRRATFLDYFTYQLVTFAVAAGVGALVYLWWRRKRGHRPPPQVTPEGLRDVAESLRPWRLVGTVSEWWKGRAGKGGHPDENG